MDTAQMPDDPLADMPQESLIQFTRKGFYCPQGDFYIDPSWPVDRAIITHAHSDHARMGSKHYLCHHLTKPLLQLRLGDNNYQSIGWGEPVYINGAKISLHPAGHIIGSSQVRIEYKGEIWVASGDYKTENDGLSGAFEPVPCHNFITESTFGLPIYQWKPQAVIYKEIQDWILANQAEEHQSVLIAYSLGKAQRVLQAAAAVTDNIFVHGAIWNSHVALLAAGIDLPTVKRVTPETTKTELKNAVIIAPPSADGTQWMKKFNPYRVAVCSGWMQVRGNSRRQNVDAGFALSDHADWNGLLQAVKATGAEKVYVTHGFEAAFARYLNENGIAAATVKGGFVPVPIEETVVNNDDYGE
ncbi:ligase-associated DNA damage response exonuclease [Parasediminibacterium sp. JCM 36343]|uniref:ligase-associated DNA damage response exonuclease n=1 Tax=Parasediminibacterium sp. JCM 36343 TaxID=3374279 RepID=UPI00397BAD85